MEMEEIEIQLEEAKKLQRFGFMNIQHYQVHKDHVVMGFTLFGDSFLQALGAALKLADPDSSIKIMRYWSNQCEQHAILYKMFLAKQKVEQGNGC